MTPDPTVARQANGLFNGVNAYVVDSLEDTNKVVQDACIEAIKAGIAKEGDRMVVVCGNTFGKGANDQIKVEFVHSKGADLSPRMRAKNMPPGLMSSGFQLSL